MPGDAELAVDRVGGSAGAEPPIPYRVARVWPALLVGVDAEDALHRLDVRATA